MFVQILRTRRVRNPQFPPMAEIAAAGGAAARSPNRTALCLITYIIPILYALVNDCFEIDKHCYD